MIVGMNAGLEYPDGRDANTDTGLWLHHVRYSKFEGLTKVTDGSI
jgi:hypothetical protein